MTCPKCASAHTMSTTKKESFRVTWMVAGWKDAREDAEIKAVTHRCLDCGAEWGEE